MHQYREYIIENLQNGYTQSEVIRQLQHLYGYSRSRTLAHRYMEDLIKQYSPTVTRYRSSKHTTAAARGMGASGKKSCFMNAGKLYPRVSGYFYQQKSGTAISFHRKV